MTGLIHRARSAKVQTVRRCNRRTAPPHRSASGHPYCGSGSRPTISCEDRPRAAPTRRCPRNSRPCGSATVLSSWPPPAPPWAGGSARPPSSGWPVPSALLRPDRPRESLAQHRELLSGRIFGVGWRSCWSGPGSSSLFSYSRDVDLHGVRTGVSRPLTAPHYGVEQWHYPLDVRVSSRSAVHRPHGDLAGPATASTGPQGTADTPRIHWLRTSSTIWLIPPGGPKQWCEPDFCTSTTWSCRKPIPPGLGHRLRCRGPHHSDYGDGEEGCAPTR